MIKPNVKIQNELVLSILDEFNKTKEAQDIKPFKATTGIFLYKEYALIYTQQQILSMAMPNLKACDWAVFFGKLDKYAVNPYRYKELVFIGNDSILTSQFLEKFLAKDSMVKLYNLKLSLEPELIQPITSMNESNGWFCIVKLDKPHDK